MGHRWVVAVDTGIAPQVQHSHANCVPCIVRRANSKGQGGCRTWDCPAGSHSLPLGCPKLIRGTAGNLLPRHLLGNHRTEFHTPRRGGMNQKHTTHNRQANVRLGHGSPIDPAGTLFHRTTQATSTCPTRCDRTIGATAICSPKSGPLKVAVWHGSLQCNKLEQPL